MFPIAKLQFEIELLDDLAPRGYWGSRLRGGFGDGLKLSLCPNASRSNLRQHSDSCSCEFQRIFKPTQQLLGITLVGSPMGGSSNLPPPFVIDAPAEMRHSAKGSRVNFNFVAIGPMCDYIEQCVDAFTEFGRFGIESREGQVRSEFLITDIRDQLAFGHSVFVNGKLGPVKREDVGETVRSLGIKSESGELTVSFRTNVQIIDKSVRSRNPMDRIKVFDNFWSFVSQVAHRTACLWQVYGCDWQGKERYGEEKGFLSHASQQIVTLENNLEKRELWGHSKERDVDKGLHGFVGTMKFHGNFSPFIHLLGIGEIVHIGSETPSGLGQYSFVLNDSEMDATVGKEL
jgi:hypothetical protein